MDATPDDMTPRIRDKMTSTCAGLIGGLTPQQLQAEMANPDFDIETFAVSPINFF